MKRIDLTLELSNICNYSCDMCFLNEKDVLEPGFMEKRTAQNFLDQLSSSNYTVNVLRVFWAGESMLNPEFKEIITMLAESERINSLSFDTNGSRLSENMCDFLLNISLKKKLNIIVSLDSLEEQTYRMIRGAENVSAVISGIEYLINNIHIKGVKERFNLAVQFIVHPVNSNQLGDFIKFWESRFKDNLDFNIMLNAGMAEKNGISIRPLTIQDERMNISQNDANILYENTLKTFGLIDSDSKINNLAQGGGNIEIC